MKDLYQRLDLAPYADADAVRAALQKPATDAPLRADGQAVLLTPRHRQAYDRSHRLLTTVGQLRRRMDLHLRPFWARSGNEDFTVSNATGPEIPAVMMRSVGGHSSHRTARWLALIVILSVLVAVALIAWKLDARR